MSSEGEPESKKLRSSEPDLKVIIGSDDAEKAVVADADSKAGVKTDGKDDGDAEKKQPAVVTKWYHSQTLATKSKYIDALLAAPMKESESRTITFPDISPETWDLMMKFVDDPLASRSMTAQDVAKVAKFYDKYEFTSGTSLCDAILAEYFKSIHKDLYQRKITVAPDVDFAVNSVVLAHEANLDEAYVEGMGFMWGAVNGVFAPFGRTMFLEDHMKKLAPLLEKTKGGISRDLAPYDLKSDAFPTDFVKNCSNWLTIENMSRFISHIRVLGSTCKVDGDYKGQPPAFRADDGRKVEWGGVMMHPLLECRTTEEGWAIVLETIPPLDEDGEPDYDSIIETVAWRAPHSGNMTFPPSEGWVPVHPLARGNIELTYVLKKEVKMQ